MIADWLAPTLLLLPALLWFFFGVGVPWALALLPRAEWRNLPMVAAIALMLGPTFITTIMFIIGTFGKWTYWNVFASSVVLAALGAYFAWRRRDAPANLSTAAPLTGLEAFLLVLIVVALLLRFWNTAYWPYANYDELWVFGYNARVFALTGAIPRSIGYYPQLIPLSLTYGQLAWGAENVHAARTVVPYFGLASILIVYVTAARFGGRRAGLIAAAIWTLYPHNAGWAQYADLEIPVTFLFTGAAAFFVFAWLERERHFAVIGGLFAAAALWTKPTAGALIESVALIAIGWTMWQVRTRRKAIRAVAHSIFDSPIPLFGLTLLPIGGMWYLRNIAFGHPPLVLPGGYWQEAAQRSGQEFGWPLLLLALFLLYLIKTGRSTRLLVPGYMLILIPVLLSAFDQPNPHRLTLLEYAVMLGGAALILPSGLAWWRAQSPRTRTTILLFAAFILPYWVTWYWSYSYHFRLSFAVVPLFIVPLALLADRLFAPVIVTSRRRLVFAGAVFVLVALPAYNESANELCVVGALSDDHAKQAAANPALLTLVDFLQAAKDKLGRPLRVVAPAELRLPYFFPFDDMRVADTYPMRLSELRDVDFFVDSSVGQRLYLLNDKFAYNQIFGSLTRIEAMKRVMTTDDHDFRFSVYTLNDADRFKQPEAAVYPNVQFGAFAMLDGFSMSRLDATLGTKLFMTLTWKALGPADRDYSVFIHFIDQQTGALGAQIGGEPVSGAFSVWQGVQGEHFSVKYHTRLWEPGEYIRDEWVLLFSEDNPPGRYDIRIGFFDPLATENARLIVSKDGQPLGDSYLLDNRFEIRR